MQMKKGLTQRWLHSTYYVVMGYLENYRHFLQSTSDIQDYNIKSLWGLQIYTISLERNTD